jgi:RNA polymerase sigma factor (sigma-70 family)
MADTPFKSAFCRYLFALAYAPALHTGYPFDDAEDCATAFVEHMLAENGRALRAYPPGCCLAAWLRECAANFVRNDRRTQARRLRHEGPWPEAVCPDESRLRWDGPDSALTPEEAMLHQQAWEEVKAAIAQLPSAQRELVVRHHLDGESIQALTASTGKTANAVEQALHRARRRLCALLERRGWTEAELRACLASPPPHIANISFTTSFG